MNWTDRQIDAIEKSGMNLLVSAAAGSGKTAVLVERVKRLILTEDVGVNEVLVVTFTNAAAAEMKEKIYSSLNKALAEYPEDLEKQQRLRQQLSLIGRSNISTFHAFAYEVVRRYYHVIGKPPGLTLCDEVRQRILKAEAMDALFERSFERGDPAFLSFMDRYATAKSDATVREMILKLHTFLQSLPDPGGWIAERLADAPEERTLPGKDPVALHLRTRVLRELRWIIAYLEKATEVLSAQIDESGTPCLQDLSQKNARDAETFRALLQQAESGDFFAVRDLLAEGVSFTRMDLKKTEKPYYDEGLKTQVNELRNAAKKRVRTLLNLWTVRDWSAVSREAGLTRPLLDTLSGLVLAFDEIYAEKKAKKNLLDFSDIEHFALAILQDPEVCREYREQFRYIFIDEYQDSNEVQEALIRQICRKDNLFMVGDVKQSIYKFRLAEPELFIEKYLSFKSGRCARNGIVDLNSNFRSKQGIIDLVNRVFSSVMNPEATGLTYDSDAALIRGSTYEGPRDEPPELYLVDTDDGEASEIDPEIAELKAVELEALQAAAIIKSQRGKIIYDEKAGVERPLAYRDMALLMRAVSGNGEVYYRTLVDAGIPVILDRNEGYFNTMEIQVFLNLLRLIDNRKQDIPLLSVLRSPIFGFSAEDLAAVRIFAGQTRTEKMSYNEAFLHYINDGPRDTLQEKCAAFLEKLAYWRDQAMHRPLGDFLWSLMVDTRYNIFVRAIPGGTQRQANLQALVDRAAAYEGENFGGLHGFIRHVAFLADKKAQINVGQASILAEDADAVQIMTIHKSKGLEFPLVLLAGLNKALLHRDGGFPLACHKDLGLGFRFIDSARGICADSLAYRMISDRMRQEELAEAIRILYVAMTRPKDRLVLLAAVRKPAEAIRKAEAILPGDVEYAGSYLDLLLSAAGKSMPIIIVDKSRLALGKEKEQLSRRQLREDLERGFSQGSGRTDPRREEWISYLAEPCFGPDVPQEPVKLTVSQIAATEAGTTPVGRRLAIDSEEEEGWEAGRPGKLFAFRRPVFLSEAKELSPAEKGTAYHSVLERIPFTERCQREEEITAFLKDLTERELITSEEAAAVDPARIAAFFRSEIGRRILAAPEVFREASFVMRTTFRGSERLVQGTIDCCFMEDDHWVLVDYKSNYVDMKTWQQEKERLLQTYQTQMRLYKEALEKITNIPVKEAVLYLLAAEDQMKMTY